jgi:uncharacterized glyoxalase superfamily protein PhnB
MPYIPAEGFPRVMARLRYEDVSAAVSWLTRAFGFREYLRWADQGGTVQHAQIHLGEVFVELSLAHGDYQTPHRLGKWSQSLIVLVDDVDAHYARARAGGGGVATGPADMVVVAVSGVERGDQRLRIAEDHADAAPPASSRSA